MFNNFHYVSLYQAWNKAHKITNTQYFYDDYYVNERKENVRKEQEKLALFLNFIQNNTFEDTSKIKKTFTKNGWIKWFFMLLNPNVCFTVLKSYEKRKQKGELYISPTLFLSMYLDFSVENLDFIEWDKDLKHLKEMYLVKNLCLKRQMKTNCICYNSEVYKREHYNDPLPEYSVVESFKSVKSPSELRCFFKKRFADFDIFYEEGCESGFELLSRIKNNCVITSYEHWHEYENTDLDIINSDSEFSASVSFEKFCDITDYKEWEKFSYQFKNHKMLLSAKTLFNFAACGSVYSNFKDIFNVGSSFLILIFIFVQLFFIFGLFIDKLVFRYHLKMNIIRIGHRGNCMIRFIDQLNYHEQGEGFYAITNIRNGMKHLEFVETVPDGSYSLGTFVKKEYAQLLLSMRYTLIGYNLWLHNSSDHVLEDGHIKSDWSSRLGLNDIEFYLSDFYCNIPDKDEFFREAEIISPILVKKYFDIDITLDENRVLFSNDIGAYKKRVIKNCIANVFHKHEYPYHHLCKGNEKIKNLFLKDFCQMSESMSEVLIAAEKQQLNNILSLSVPIYQKSIKNYDLMELKKGLIETEGECLYPAQAKESYLSESRVDITVKHINPLEIIADICVEFEEEMINIVEIKNKSSRYSLSKDRKEREKYFSRKNHYDEKQRKRLAKERNKLKSLKGKSLKIKDLFKVTKKSSFAEAVSYKTEMFIKKQNIQHFVTGLLLKFFYKYNIIPIKLNAYLSYDNLSNMIYRNHFIKPLLRRIPHQSKSILIHIIKNNKGV